jgi:hypothetical protein
MKNLFNNISESEKSRILEMHSGLKKIISEDDMDSLNIGGGDPTPLKNVMGTKNFQSKFGVKYTNVMPGDNTYAYGKCNGKWYTHNLKTTKETDLSSNPKFASSVAILEKKFPNANNCIKKDLIPA